MSLSAGAVYATLGGRFDPAGFVRFGAAMRTAEGQMEASEKRMRTSAERTTASMHAIGHAAKVGAGAGILGLGAIIAGSVKKAADFESQLASLKAVSNATGREMQLLRKQAMEAGAATKYSALQAAQAQTELAKGGLSTAKILSGGLSGALALAAAGEMDLADAAATTANALNLFKLNGTQATHVADAMAQAANSTTADVSDFAMALTQGGAAAKAAGLTFDQTMVALEALANAGVKGSDAGTSLKAAFTQLASPTKQQADLADKLGVNFFKANGHMKEMPQIADMLRDKLGGLTKQQRLQAVSTLAGTDGMRTLLALFDSGKDRLAKYGTELGKSGTAAKVAAEKQDTLKGKIENLKGSIETAGIKIGTALLPMFERLAIKGTEWVNNLVASGQLDRFAAGVEEAFRTLGTVLSDFWGLAHPVVDLFLDLGRAIGLADATTIEAIAAALVTFKVAGTVAPMVQTLSGAIGDLVLNARTAPTLMAFFKSVPIGPWTLLAGGIAAVAAALVGLGSHESTEEELARNNAEAHREQADAIRDVMRAEQEAADAGLAAERADLNRADAHDRVLAARKALAALPDDAPKPAVAAAHREVARAVNDEKQAVLDARGAHAKYTADVGVQASKNVAAIVKSLGQVAKAQKALNDASRAQGVTVGAGKGGVSPGPVNERARLAATQNLTAATQLYVQALARAQVSDISRQRLMNASSQITEKNAAGIAHLVQAMGKVPTKVQSKVLLEDQNALAEIGTLASKLKGVDRQKTVAKILTTAESASSQVLAFKAVVAGVPPRKVFNIIQNARTAKGEIDALRSAIAAIPASKTTTITTRRITEFQEVRPPKKAAGGKTSGPQLYLVGEGSDPVEWIIPRDPKHRGRAVSLLMDAAASILPGAKKGAKVGGAKVKKPGSLKQALHLPIPAKIAEAGVPFEDVQSDRDRIHGDYAQARKDAAKAHTKYNKILGDLEDARNDTRKLESGPYKGQPANHTLRKSLTKRLAEAKKERDKADAKEKRLKPMAAYVDRLFAAARTTHTRAEQMQSNINLQAQNMADADRTGDQSGYDAARSKRRTSIRNLIKVLQRALSLANPKSAYARQLREQLAQLGGGPAVAGMTPSAETQFGFGGELGDDALSGAESDAMALADDEAETGMTEAERDQLAKIDEDIALAALTDTLDDDRLHAGEKVSLLERVLGELGPGGSRPGTPAAITSVAQALKSAQDTVKDLSRAPDKTADQEAQLAQANARAAAAEEGRRTSDALLRTIMGPGDIGTGGRTAGGVVIEQNIQTLHPGSPQLLRAIGDAAVSGIALQPSSSPPRERLGI